MELEDQTFFVDVLLPLPLPKPFTYRVPRNMEHFLQKHIRVVVPFGSQKVITGLILDFHHHPPKNYSAKYLLEILDSSPIISNQQIELFNWISQYYFCQLGEVFNAALPSGLKISSESKVQINPNFLDFQELSPREAEIFNLIKEKNELNYDSIASALEIKSAYHYIKAMVQKGAIFIFDELKYRYTPKVIRKIRLTKDYVSLEAINQLIHTLEKKSKQLEVVLFYLSFVPINKLEELNEKGIAKSICNDLSESSIQTLVKNRVFEFFEQIVSRFDENDETIENHTLSVHQKLAYDSILEQFMQKETILFHGVTGSGKTEVYIELIKEVIQQGDQVLFLLPEIALTTQMVIRLKRIFGDKMGVYHSKYSENERVEVWNSILEEKFSLIVGVRSAVFLPFNKLGLIIVDEEHEPSYKQVDPAPRYHARDVALYLAQKHHSKVLLGSATPSLESYYSAQTGKFGFVELKHRFGNIPLPNIHLISLKEKMKSKKWKGGLSEELIQLLNANYEKGKQSLLFQNRRGYSPYLQCQDCEWIAPCIQCDVSLTYHHQANELKCHYCGYKETLPRRCSACGSTNIMTMGYGTEKVEEEIELIFPNAKIARVDLDTTRSKTAISSLLKDVQNGEVDFIVGTQMVAKGLDFDNLNLVAILDADRMINFPDFRSHERAFQLLTQVAGRAGRRSEVGQVYMQTAQPSHYLIQAIQNHGYEKVYQTEIQERENFHYPPFSKLIKIILKHPEREAVHLAAFDLGRKLKIKYGTQRVLGPEAPMIEKIRNQYAREIMIKLEKTASPSKFKSLIKEDFEEWFKEKVYRKVQIIVDVDPI
ncbi:MAG: Primosomal protein [Bacteroidota bacterium]